MFECRYGIHTFIFNVTDTGFEQSPRAKSRRSNNGVDAEQPCIHATESSAESLLG